MPEPSSPPRPMSLYEVLGEPAPLGGPRGETRKSSTKETIDDDREALEAVTVLGGH